MDTDHSFTTKPCNMAPTPLAIVAPQVSWTRLTVGAVEPYAAVQKFRVTIDPKAEAITVGHRSDVAVRLLLRFPRLGAPGPKGSRKLRLDNFPYTVHYRLDGG